MFQTFLKFRTVAKVMRVLNDARPRSAAPRPSWRSAAGRGDGHRRSSAILKNPAYAGAFVYGRTRLRNAARRRFGR